MIKIDYDRQREGQSVYENYIGALQVSDQSKIVWYSATGNDSTGNGTVATPYQTRAKANSETSAAKPYALLVDDFYIPGYSSSNIIYLDTVSGNDSNDGSTELLAKLTYASAVTAAGSTKKIRVINDGAVLTSNITKPTEAKAGIVANITGDQTPLDTWNTSLLNSNFTSYPISKSDKLQKVIFSGYNQGGDTYGRVVSANYSNLASFSSSSPSDFAVASGIIYTSCWSDRLNKFFIAGANGKIMSSVDGSIWVSIQSPTTFTIRCIIDCENLGRMVAVGDYGIALYSDDGETWLSSDISATNAGLYSVAYSPVSNVMFAVGANDLKKSTDGKIWVSLSASEMPTGIDGSYGLYVFYLKTLGKFAYRYTNGSSASKIGICTDFTDWTTYDPPVAPAEMATFDYVSELNTYIFGTNASGQFFYTDDLSSWTEITGVTNASAINGGVYIEQLRKYVYSMNGYSIVSDPFSVTISANVSGFDIKGVLYSGTITLNNCTLYQHGYENSISTTRCHSNHGVFAKSNTQSNTRLLSDGPAYFTTTPAAQNAFSLDACTFTDGAFIYNASQTGYERIRDTIIESGLYANYLVTVTTGNVTGVSTNALLTASVGTSDPLLGDDGRPNRPWLPSGSGTESPVIAVALYSTNSDGVKNDLGCFIVNDEDVGYTYKKSKYLPSGSLKIGKGIESSEQVGDDGEVDVFGNPQRAVEVVLINYESLSPEDTAFVDELDELNDYHVRLNLYPSTQIVTGSVTVNGNQSSGAFTLAVDATAIHPGATLTIGGVEYYILYASPNYTAATTLVLNKPLESNVLDNDVITTSYPAGYGEYSYSPKSRELQLSVAQSPSAYFINVALRFIRKWQS